MLTSWVRAVSTSCRVVVCSCNFVTAVADVQRDRLVCLSVFVGVSDGVSIEVGDLWKVDDDILVVDLTECHKLRLSAIYTSLAH